MIEAQNTSHLIEMLRYKRGIPDTLIFLLMLASSHNKKVEKWKMNEAQNTSHFIEMLQYKRGIPDTLISNATVARQYVKQAGLGTWSVFD